MTITINTSAKPLVSVKGLSKSYSAGWSFPWLHRNPQIIALDHFGIDIYPGEIHGLIGPNGAGKTTLLKILWQMVQPDAGTIQLDGIDYAQMTLVSGEERGFYFRLSGWENLVFFGRLSGLTRKQTIKQATNPAKQLGLSEILSRRYQTYSTGEKQKLAILRGLLCSPRLLMLDELAKGLDPQATAGITVILQGLAKKGMSILLATHRLDLASQICQTVTMIHHGKTLASGSPAELSRQLSSLHRYRLVIIGERDSAQSLLKPYLRSELCENNGRLCAELTLANEKDLAELSLKLASSNISILELSPLEEGLEEVYNRLLVNEQHED
jgi:ABC-2 type transport system ATP-binding protein